MTTKDQLHKELFDKAHSAGMLAGGKHVPTPMIVGEAKDLFSNDIDYDKPVYHVPQGVCGFAWIVVTPGTGSFARWLMKNGGHKNYYGGTGYFVHEFGQSMECKQQYAYAFASVLNDAGVNAHGESRMD